MKSSQKKILYDQFSKILNLKNDLIYSVPWIQPVKIDDTLIKNYRFIFKFKLSNFIFNFSKSLYEILICFIKVILSIFIKVKKKNLDCNILILSHLVNINNFKSKNDIYFGKLEENLNKLGKTTTKYYLNHTNLKQSEISKYQIQILPKIDSFKIEFEVLYNQIKLFIFSLSKIFYLYKKNNKLSLIIIFLLQTFSYHTQSALRIGIQIKQLIKGTNIKYIFMTFEGHCYEKIMNLYNKNISIIAYQNTPLSFSQFSIDFYSFNTIPNIILAKNIIYKKFLERKLNFNNKIIDFGDLDFKYIRNIPTSKKKISKSILFVPEGIDKEVNIMVNYIKKNYKINKDIYFTIRFHPVFPKTLINKYKSKFNNVSNVIFSEKTVEDDFSKNTYVIYRGSSLIFDAIRAGLIPIYLNTGININILDMLELFNNEVNFETNLNEFYLKSLSLESESVSEFAKLFYPPKYKNLINEIK